jgi:hypothetical protein
MAGLGLEARGGAVPGAVLGAGVGAVLEAVLVAGVGSGPGAGVWMKCMGGDVFPPQKPTYNPPNATGPEHIYPRQTSVQQERTGVRLPLEDRHC